LRKVCPYIIRQRARERYNSVIARDADVHQSTFLFKVLDHAHAPQRKDPVFAAGDEDHRELQALRAMDGHQGGAVGVFAELFA
jgi:hypothetical protein